MRVLVFAAIAVTVSAGSEPDAFQSFASGFSKSYKSLEELRYRRAIFNDNHRMIVEHNKRYDAGVETWWMKMNEDMDLTHQEWMDKWTGGLPAYDRSTNFTNTVDDVILAKLSSMGTPSEEFNWVTQGMVSSVKNQGQCGSCAAFSVMGTIESCFAIKHGDRVDDLSEQHILDCAYHHQVTDESGTWGAYGCQGAWPNAYLDWLMGKHYNQDEYSYPYISGATGDVYSCRPEEDGYHTDSMVTGMYNVWYPEEIEMENLVTINPVSTAVFATRNWSHYGGGVLVDRTCCDAAYDEDCVYGLNHAIIVVGYGHDIYSDLDYWIIKNSWGKSWGNKGYMWLKKGTGHCGVGSLHQTIPKC